MEKAEKKRGGSRTGAGRPKTKDRSRAVTVRLSALAKERLDAHAAGRGVSRQEALNDLLEAL